MNRDRDSWRGYSHRVIIGRDLLGRASRLVARGAEEAARSVGSILRPVVEKPDEALCRSLCDLGPEGHRAQQFLHSAAEQLNSPGSRAGEHASYAVREALNALIALGGSRPRGMGSGVKRVLQRWSKAEGDLDSGPLTEAVAELRVLEEGPGPNEIRLITLMLGSTLPLWELERVGAVGLSLLAADTGDQTERTDLKNRLFERGFHEAADL